jgi:hypothetical protein
MTTAGVEYTRYLDIKSERSELYPKRLYNGPEMNITNSIASTEHVEVKIPLWK